MHNYQTITFTKTCKVKTPAKASPAEAGIDFYIPDGFQTTTLKPQERILIPAGIKLILPEHTCLLMTNKSGVASKKGLDVLACCIDETYRGEIHINLVNTGTEDVVLEAGDKIVQGILHDLPDIQMLLVSPEEYERHPMFKTVRGAGGFGHTGDK